MTMRPPCEKAGINRMARANELAPNPRYGLRERVDPLRSPGERVIRTEIGSRVVLSVVDAPIDHRRGERITCTVHV